jgi:hypothetical protein
MIAANAGESACATPWRQQHGSKWGRRFRLPTKIFSFPIMALLAAASSSFCQVAKLSASIPCASCHAAESADQSATPMGHALEAVGDCSILKAHAVLTFQTAKYSYRIERKGSQSMYSVTDGVRTITVPIGWAFGLGQAGQTYVFEQEGRFYESRVSFYKAIDGLDWTMGAINQVPLDLLQAAGRELGKQEAAQCFHCHASNGGEGLNLNLSSLNPGIQCERCHGPATDHMASFKTGKPVPMKKLTDGTAEEMNTFCGSCHRTWDEIATGPKLGVANVRFQPYRLTNSKCYDSADARISCVVCHDPHHPLNVDQASYDSKCVACHSEGGNAKARLCKVSKNNCVSCHMPQIDMPGGHRTFTDHQIRFVWANERYPE